MRTVVAIDGPAGSGKSTVARRLALELGYTFLDSGAFFRAITLKATREKMDLSDEASIVSLFDRTEITLAGSATLLDGVDVSDEIRMPGLAEKVGPLAAMPEVRARMAERLKTFAGDCDIVTEGRDQGSIVFPEAKYKFYLTATIDERVRRRADELRLRGTPVDPGKLRKEILHRDGRDSTRKVAPLVKAEDAIEVDTTGLTIEEVVAKLFGLVGGDG